MRLERVANAAAAAVCIGALLYAILWLQQGLGLEPCPLCILDRVAFAVAAVVFLLAALQGPGAFGRRVYAAVALCPLVFGIGVASRHVWLQHLPKGQVPACGPSLDYILQNFPLSRGLDLILRGSGECATVHWRFVGLSIPEWTLILFLGLSALSLWLLLRRASPRPF